MKNPDFQETHFRNTNNEPAGGVSTGTGFTIAWQKTDVPPEQGKGQEINGASVEEVLDAVSGRISFYDRTRYASEENKKALHYIELAKESLRNTTTDRTPRSEGGM